MFGYIICNRKQLDKKETERYQEIYCGLCKTLEKKFGQLSRLSLNYDMTVALSYFKCLDDWQDEKKHLQYQYAKKMEKNYADIKKRCPKQCETIENGMRELHEIEQSAVSLADESTNCFGRIMAEMFVVEEDFWSNSLRNFGYHLGRFIYVMDGTMDYQKDKKTGNYNPLKSIEKKPEDMEELLTMMIEDPYKVLGVPHDATKEEIKKAYRKKAKEYHPDLHPDDSEAARKMNEVNAAYDMLNNPDKYKKQQRTSSSYQGTSGNTYRNTYENSGWNDFDFDDMFGFSGRYHETIHPKAEPDDSNEIRQVIEFISRRQFHYANSTLNTIVSYERNARWYYLSAVANQGLGNMLLAAQHIDKAVQMEPENPEYQKTRQQLHRTEYNYNDVGREFQRYADGMNRFCFGLCATQFFCTFCWH